MAKSWTINANKPSKLESYEWSFPDSQDSEDVKETTAPGDLIIKPENIDLIPTLEPTRSGIQSGHNSWNFEAAADSSWYVFGQII